MIIIIIIIVIVIVIIMIMIIIAMALFSNAFNAFVKGFKAYLTDC